MTGPRFEIQRVQGSAVSTEELLADLRQAAERSGSPVLSQRAYSQFGLYDPKTLSRRFGTWNEAVRAAGLETANEVNISDGLLFQNIMDLWTYYGRQPRLNELARAPSQISAGPYSRRFRSWLAALQAFVEYANSIEANLPEVTERTNSQKAGLDPSLRTRFRVLKRDNFSCRACGASPSTRPGLSLHVDHVTPWSKGGETVDENLQTLCEPCNLGKSNVL